MNKNGIVYTVIFTFITAFFFVFFLSLAAGATSERVQQNQIVSIQKSILTAIGKMPANAADVSKTYAREFDTVPSAGDTMTSRLDGEDILIRYFSGSGLWGTITGILAVEADFERIIGLDIISHNETPGLGGRIDESWFKEQFRGEKISADGIALRKGEGSQDTDPDNSSVDGITGASLTSSSMEKIINLQLQDLKGGAK